MLWNFLFYYSVFQNNVFSRALSMKIVEDVHVCKVFYFVDARILLYSVYRAIISL